jgi:maltose O-acetyltransferase
MRSGGNSLRRLRHRLVDRLRGDAPLDRLVAQGMQVGVNTHIARQIYIDHVAPWLISIGDYSTIGPYTAIITHDTSLVHHTGQTRLGRVDIGERVYIGVGAILLPGTTIGEDSVVGAGAVVHGDVPPGSLVLGNPAKISPVKSVVAWQKMSAARAPQWPREGWTNVGGITEENKRIQREALANGAAGYVPARSAPGSSFELADPRS